MQSWLEQARRASDLTVADCARLLNQDEEEFLIRENSPGKLTLNEIHALYVEFNNESRAILWRALSEFDPSLCS